MVSLLRRFFSIATIACLIIPLFLASVPLAEGQKIYVAFIWHYHQPWYYSIDETYFELPWVRMHSVGNYYKMAYILSKYPEVKATFTFSGSLLTQIIDYVENGKMDIREIISWRVVNRTVTRNDVYSMLRIPGGFFDINWARIVDRSPRYRELRDLAQRLHSTCLTTARTPEEYVDCVVDGFTGGNLLNQTVVDLAVLFNLLWIDPQVAQEEYPLAYSLMQKAYNERYPNFTLDDLRYVLSVHRSIMLKVVLAYKELVERRQVELIPVPYGHPIAPLLVDFGLADDLHVHVIMSVIAFQVYFNYRPRGIWPAEQAVNEHAVQIFRRAGISWTITDSTVLLQTGANVASIEDLGVPWYIDFPEGRIYIFFRETEISNLISFQYSGWDQDSAVNDLVNRLLSYARQAQGPRVVVIALDGENPWEHYPEFGTVFLNKLYSRLQELQRQGIVETITPGEFVERFSNVAKPLPQREYLYLDLEKKDISNLPLNSYGDAYGDLPRRRVTARLPEGSWGGDLSIWIGHRQENVAWMWLIKAREDVLRKLNVESFLELYARFPEVAEYIMRAQTSCWFWWYGGDGGGSPAPFDPLYKNYLRRAYELAGIKPPEYLLSYAYPDGAPRGLINLVPPSMLDKPPVVDGVLEDLWRTASREGKALELVVGSIVTRAYVGVDREKVYFAFVISAQRLDNVKIAVYFATPSASLSPVNPGYVLYPRNATVDLAIYLTREVLIDLGTRRAQISKAENGTWTALGEAILAIGGSPGNYVVEVSAGILELDLAMGQPAYFAIAVYVNDELYEWSSRYDMAYQLYIPIPSPLLMGRVIIDVKDPVGDDDGPGGFEYPLNPVFARGVFDLTRFVVIDAGDRLIFITYFVTLGGNPWSGPNGWSMQQIHIYIKTTLQTEGKYEAIALNIIVEHGWHMALLVAPGWGTDPLPRGERTALYYYDRDEPLVQNGLLRAYADHAENAIIVEVSKTVMYDVDNVDKWIFVVAVTSHDGYGVNRIRPFSPSKGEWNIYVPTEYAMAILQDVLPYVMDLLAPTKEDQYSMLRSFDPATRTLARVRGVGLHEPVTTPIETPLTPLTTPSPTQTTPLETPLTTPAVTTPSPEYPWIPVVAIIAIAAVVAIVFVLLKRRR
ncbi:MAG: glucodextranase DOMON-like domain-containing protein [Desulfurococcaceae archaeon]